MIPYSQFAAAGYAAGDTAWAAAGYAARAAAGDTAWEHMLDILKQTINDIEVTQCDNNS